MKIVAVGDVHGCVLNLGNILLDPEVTGDELIFLGDLFDRSPFLDGDKTVLEIVQEAQKSPEEFGFKKVTVLRGNHEDLLIRAIERGPESEARELWEYNGGEPTFIPVASENLEWLKSLPLYAERGDYLFVHAGVRPDVPLEEQTESDLMWIREEFHDAEDHGLPYIVVHGHTPVSEIEVAHKRINLDTGCFYTGNLSYMEFNNGTERMGSEDEQAGSSDGGDSECSHSE